MAWLEYAKTFAVLFAVLGFALVILIAAKRLRTRVGFASGNKELGCCEFLALDVNSRLVLVRMRSRRYLLLLSSRGNLMLDKIDEE